MSARRPGLGGALFRTMRRIRRSPGWIVPAGLLAVACADSSEQRVEKILSSGRAGGEAAVEAARGALADEDPRVRALAAWRLGEAAAAAAPAAGVAVVAEAAATTASATLSDLLPLIQDRSPNVRAAALGALFSDPCLVADGDLVHLFRDAEPIVRLRAVRLFAACTRPGDASSAGRLSALLGALDDKDADVREAVVRAIGIERGRECNGALPAEVSAAGNPGAAIPGEAVPGAPREQGCASPEDEALRAREIVSRLGSVALTDPEARVRASAAGALGLEVPEEAGNFLQFVLLDAQPLVRLAGQDAIRERARAEMSARAAREALAAAERTERTPSAKPLEPGQPREKRKPAEDDPLPAAGEGGDG